MVMSDNAGIDYLSVATYVDLAPAHRFLLGKVNLVRVDFTYENSLNLLFKLHMQQVLTR